MRFKSLSLFGFKSFADKTYLELPEGITCVVGPNGSGKSNILDALRWVLGEQSPSELRGVEMGEVIFGGTQARRGANFAEVLLTLEDVDANISQKWGSSSELAVCRKIYRTGEREYLINGRKARLKDVRDIFFDAGVSSKSISIIEQEKVTKIVNAAPLELRNYLEEAAGLIRYRQQRKQAELRLKQTAENLTRIGDILSVLSEDIIRLEGQVSLLEEYKRLKNEKETLEKTSIIIRYRQIKREKKNHLSQIEGLQERALSLTREHTDKVNEELGLNQAHALLRSEIDSARENLENSRKELARLERVIQDRESERINAQNTITIAQEDIKTISESLIHKELSLNDAEEQQTLDMALVDRSKEKLDEVKGSLSALKASLALINNKKKEENQKYIRFTELVSDCKNRLSLKRAELETSETYIHRYNREIETFNADFAKADDSLIKAEAEAAEAAEQLREGRKELDIAKLERDAVKKECALQESSLLKLSTELKITRERIAFLKKELSQKSGGEFIERFKAVRYASLCTDEELKGLYSALLIVDDPFLAEALEFAKNSEDPLEFALKSSLDTLFQDRSEKGERIAEGLYKINNIYKKVGAESLTLLKLTKRIEEDEAAYHQLEIKLGEAQAAEVNKKKALVLAEDRTLKLLELLRKSEQRLSSLKGGIVHFEQQKRDLLRKAKTVEREKELLIKGRDGASPEIERLEGELIWAERELAAQQVEIERLDENLEGENLKADELRSRELEYEKEFAALSSRIKARGIEIEKLKSDIEDGGKNREKLEKRIIEAETVLSGEEYLNKLKEELEAAEINSLNCSERVNKLTARETEFERSFSEVRSDMDRLAKLLAEVDKKGEYHKAKLEGAEEGLRALETLMFSEYGEILDEMGGNYPAIDREINEINIEAAAISKKMDALGELNMAAKGEYDEKLSQYKRQSEQLDDIKSAAAS
ncbi:MAG: AAA family ATPase, partial [Deferribacteraceae bacterium]|nr:AAA family ATPase [Deferribacteraceae bacterium]